MVKHKDIQDPDDYSEKERSEEHTSELQSPSATLAHLPTKRAQDLLTRFKESERAEEVEWLEIALDEGKFHYLQPNNEKESRDFLALKVIREKDDHIIELMKKKEDYELNIKKFEIELEAMEKMQKEGSAIKENISALKDLIKMEKNCLRETKDEIEFEEKLQRKIRESIDTERYKDIDPMYMDDIIF